MVVSKLKRALPGSWIVGSAAGLTTKLDARIFLTLRASTLKFKMRNQVRYAVKGYTLWFGV